MALVLLSLRMQSERSVVQLKLSIAMVMIRLLLAIV